MVTAVKTVSQVATHMGIAFAIMYWMTGSVAFGGLAALLEPICNVALLPLHEKAWRAIRARMEHYAAAYWITASAKISQAAMHMAVAFAVMYWATGSLAFGGLAAVLEPICNVILLPVHDQMWEKLRARLEMRKDERWVAA